MTCRTWTLFVALPTISLAARGPVSELSVTRLTLILDILHRKHAPAVLISAVSDLSDELSGLILLAILVVGCWGGWELALASAHSNCIAPRRLHAGLGTGQGFACYAARTDRGL